MGNKKFKLTLTQKKLIVGWMFILPCVILLAVFSFYPMFQAIYLSLHKGAVRNYTWAGLYNYTRIFKDKVFIQTLVNTLTYLVFTVPITLVLALLIAVLLNRKDIKGRGLFRTLIFLPCATSLVSYSIIFRSLFATNGFVNTALGWIGIPAVNWFGTNGTARVVIIIALIWRWTGYYMIFFLSGLQNIDSTVYEAARIDGASPRQILTRITVPLLKPTILLTGILSVNGTLQLFDESMNLTNGGPGMGTMSMSHYIYNLCFVQNPNFTYSSALSIVILMMVAVLTVVQMKVGDKRD